MRIEVSWDKIIKAGHICPPPPTHILDIQKSPHPLGLIHLHISVIEFRLQSRSILSNSPRTKEPCFWPSRKGRCFLLFVFSPYVNKLKRHAECWVPFHSFHFFMVLFMFYLAIVLFKFWLKIYMSYSSSFTLFPNPCF